MVVLAVALVFVFRAIPEELDDELCPASGAKGELVVLLDASNALSALHRTALRASARRIRSGDGDEGLRPGERLVVYDLPSVPEEATARLRVCRPGVDAEAQGLLDGLTEGSLYRLAKWRRFERTLESLWVVPAQELPGSPLLEMIRILALTHTPTGDGRLRLVVWSDLIQNSAVLNQYKRGDEFVDATAFLSEDRYASLRADLSFVDVVVYQLGRPGLEAVQDHRHYAWWTEVLGGLGARVVSQTRI